MTCKFCGFFNIFQKLVMNVLYICSHGNYPFIGVFSRACPEAAAMISWSPQKTFSISQVFMRIMRVSPYSSLKWVIFTKRFAARKFHPPQSHR